jgi:hypothetical protein
LSLEKRNTICPQDVINYVQRQFDGFLNQIPFTQPQINPKVVTTWIHRGANIEAIDKDRNTVLSNAVIASNVPLVFALLKAGRSRAHRNGTGLMPLEIAKKRCTEKSFIS